MWAWINENILHPDKMIVIYFTWWTLVPLVVYLLASGYLLWNYPEVKDEQSNMATTDKSSDTKPNI